jgi:3-phenylpropionate/cinnamic acid dioxygenase small subunit
VVESEKLKLLVDRAEIADTIHHYAIALDTQNWELLRSCLADDVEIDYGVMDAEGKRTVSARELVKLAAAALTGFQATQHLLTNYDIEVSGDEATSVTYMQANHYLPNDQGDNYLKIGGHYRFRLVRTPEGWRIAKVALIVAWTEGNRHVYELAAKRSTVEVVESWN